MDMENFDKTVVKTFKTTLKVAIKRRNIIFKDTLALLSKDLIKLGFNFEGIDPLDYIKIRNKDIDIKIDGLHNTLCFFHDNGTPVYFQLSLIGEKEGMECKVFAFHIRNLEDRLLVSYIYKENPIKRIMKGKKQKEYNFRADYIEVPFDKDFSDFFDEDFTPNNEERILKAIFDFILMINDFMVINSVTREDFLADTESMNAKLLEFFSSELDRYRLEEKEKIEEVDVDLDDAISLLNDDDEEDD